MITYIAELTENHLIIKILQTIPNSVKLLVDTGSDFNLIKLFALNPIVLVDERNLYNLLSIVNDITQTFGKIIINLPLCNEDTLA